MVDREHLDILKKGVDFWNKWRKEHPDIRPDLSEAYLSGADLSQASLYGVNLSGADLSYANLSQAKLDFANLSGANLSGANLGQATLRKATLRKATLNSAKLVGADLGQADLNGADLNGADLGGVTTGNFATNLFRGRINRRSYLVGYLAGYSASLGALWVFSQLPVGLLVMLPVCVVLVWFWISIRIRRFHDFNKSGFSILWFFVPFINVYFGFLLLCEAGTDGPNRYGTPPRPCPVPVILD